MVLLGEHGLVNNVLLAMGLISAPLSLMYNRLGVLIGMSYTLMPGTMVLTLYAAMRAIDPSLLRRCRTRRERLLYLPAGVFPDPAAGRYRSAELCGAAAGSPGG